MSDHLAVTILMPTFNRAGELETTFEHFVGLDTGDLTYELVVIDNNSSDSTPEVVERFQDRLPLRYLFAEKPGKNSALNLALNTLDLGEIVVFTDDDIVPAPDWLLQIRETCRRWPDHRVFGGKIEAVMPVENPPSWTRIPLIAHFAFAVHDISEEEGTYPYKVYPFGPNYWIRKSLLEEGHRFDESIGPHPSNRILGDEILFLKELSEKGNPIVYTPHAVVGHRIQPEFISLDGIKKRAVTLGRGGPHISGLCHPGLLSRHPLVWRWLRRLSLFYYHFRYAVCQLIPSQDKRVEQTVIAIMGIWYNREALRMTETVTKPHPSTEEEASA